MGKYRKILVPFDGSAASRNALKQAIRLAQDEKSWIKVLSVVPSYEGDLSLVGVKDIKGAMAGPAERLVAEAEKIASQEKAAVITNVEQGEAYEKIVDVAESEGCDLIVMGKKGMHSIEMMLMGSVTARVIAHSTRDVLVVPNEASLGWGEILVATDGSTFSDIAVGRAIDFAKSYAGGLTAVSAVDVNEEFYAQAPEAVERMVKKAREVLDSIEAKGRGQGLEVDTYVREGEAHRVIIDLSKQKRSDIIFMGSHGKTGVKKIIMGSVTEKVVGLSNCPVLVAKGG